MDAEIIQLINQLGVSSEGQYKLHPFYKASLYQIKRHLAIDNDKTILLKCSEVNIIGNDLIPMMKLFNGDSEKKDLFLMCLKICITLMAPSVKVFEHMDRSNVEIETLISTREGYLYNIMKSIAYSDVMMHLNECLTYIIDEEEKSDISIAIKESMFHLLQLIVTTKPKCMTTDEKNIVEGALISKMVESNIIETLYKYSKNSGYKTDMFMFIHIFGQISKYVDPSCVVKAEIVKRKREERMKKLPTDVNVKDLVKSIEDDLMHKKTKPIPDNKDPLFPLVDEINRRKHSQRRRIVMNGRFSATFVDMNNFTSSGRAKIVNKIETNPMDSIVKQNNFKTFHRKAKKSDDDERILSLTDKIYIKIYNLIKLIMLSGFDFKRYVYSDIVSWCDLKSDLTDAEVNYLHLQWFMLKISRLDNIPWLFQNDFVTFENIEIWTERVIDSMNKYEKPKADCIREKCRYMLDILKEALYRIPSLKERNEGEYRALIYDLYFHSFLKSFVKIYQYLDDHLSSQSFCVSLFSLTSVYFQMAKYVNVNGGCCGQVERNDALEVKNELIEVEDLMGQFYNKNISRVIMHFAIAYTDKITPTQLHNLITVIYYSSFGLKKMIFFFEVKFFVCLRKWIYVIKKGNKNVQMLTVLENFLKRLMLHVEEYHLFGVGDSTFLNKISQAHKAKKRKAKKLENEERFNSSDEEDNFVVNEDNEDEEKVAEEENEVHEKLSKKISRVAIDDTSDVEETDDVMEKLDSQRDGNAKDDSHLLSDEESEESQSDDSKENDSEDEYKEKPNEIKPEDLFHIYNKKRSLFAESDDDDENNEEVEDSSQRPLKKRKTIMDDEDEENDE